MFFLFVGKDSYIWLIFKLILDQTVLQHPLYVSNADGEYTGKFSGTCVTYLGFETLHSQCSLTLTDPTV